MRPTVRRMRTAVQSRLSSSAISVPPTIVRLTQTAVKTTVRSSVCQKIWSWRTLLKFESPMYGPAPWTSANRSKFSSEIRTR